MAGEFKMQKTIPENVQCQRNRDGLCMCKIFNCSVLEALLFSSLLFVSCFRY